VNGDEWYPVQSGSRTVRFVVAGLLACFFVLAAPLRAQKTDVVILQNDDHITGEIKELERGILRYSTDDMSTVRIEWAEIARLTSTDFFEAEVQSGRRYFGSLSSTPQVRSMVVSAGQFVDTLDMGQVVRMVPIETTFWTRVDGFIDLGLTFARANNALHLSLGGEAAYRGVKWGGRLEGSAYFQRQDDLDGTRATSGSFRLERFFEGRWSLASLMRGERNEELDLDLRVLLGAGAIARVVQTGSALLFVSGGVAGTREAFADTETKYNLELLAVADYELFRFNDPEVDLSTELQLFPSLTSLGRVRAEFETRLTLELVSDFVIGLSIHDSFDSEPPAGDASKNDFRVTTSFGWEF